MRIACDAQGVFGSRIQHAAYRRLCMYSDTQLRTAGCFVSCEPQYPFAQMHPGPCRLAGRTKERPLVSTWAEVSVLAPWAHGCRRQSPGRSCVNSGLVPFATELPPELFSSLTRSQTFPPAPVSWGPSAMERYQVRSGNTSYEPLFCVGAHPDGTLCCSSCKHVYRYASQAELLRPAHVLLSDRATTSKPTCRGPHCRSTSGTSPVYFADQPLPVTEYATAYRIEKTHTKCVLDLSRPS